MLKKICILAALAFAGLTIAALAVQLPDDHEYQRELRAYLATLTEADFTVDLKPFEVDSAEKTDDQLYRLKVLNDFRVPFNAGLRLPASHFTLDSFESGESVMMPAITARGQSGIYHLTWLIEWDYPGNPYFGSRPLKLRALATAAVDMIMHDHGHEALGIGRRSDYLGGTLIWLASAYRAARDVMPPEARAAYETGLRKFMQRLSEWGPTGSMVDMDLFAAVSMRIVSELMDDQEISELAENYVRRLFTEERFFHPAGYFVDGGCFDTSYNGISLFFAVWAALKAPDWTFIHEALDRAYKLKGHLTFPEPDGRAYGPSSMSSRTSACPPLDQWNFPPRNIAAAMLTDQAMFLTSTPEPGSLSNVEHQLVRALNSSLEVDYQPPAPQPWVETHWGPRPNNAHDFYRPGYYDRRLALAEADSPLLVNPFLRPGNFIETFDKAFMIGKFDGYGFAIHTGPVGRRLHGWGGGALCAFWTPRSGSVMLGRRRGWARQTGLGERADSFETWRMWPVHAVTGLTDDGNIFSSARIVDPNPVYSVNGDHAEVQVHGIIPAEPTNTDDPCLRGQVRYKRSFTIGPEGLAVETSVASDGRDKVVELYETLPVFLRELRAQVRSEPTMILFMRDGDWVEATADWHANVTAIRLARFDGAVRIVFAQPQRVKLSPEDWRDYYQSAASCRTILIDLLGPVTEPVSIPDVKVSYTISCDQTREKD